MSTVTQQPATNRPFDSATALQSVASRLRIAAFGYRFYCLCLAAAAVYATLLLFSRFTGIPQGLVFHSGSLLFVPLSALLAACIWHPRPTAEEAARRIDQHTGTKDLFLTYATLERSAGDYQSLVEADADEKAQRVVPERVVPWSWESNSGKIALVVALLWLTLAFLPQFDPFGSVAKAEELEQQKAQLQKDKKATELRKAELKKRGEQSKDSDEVDKSINDLTKTLSQMKRDQPESNRKQLNGLQKEIGAKFRKLGSEKLRTLLSQNGLFQGLGGDRQQKLKKWTDQLLKGDSEELKQEMQAIKDQIQEMLNEKDPVKRAEMAKDLKEQIRDMAEFASENAGSPELTAALRRAMRQMEQAAEAGDPQQAREAMKALAESLELSEMELEEIAKAAKDMKKLEDALEALQQAKQLNASGELDGEGTEGFQSLADYKELYAELMGAGNGDGEGTGGEGTGEGGETPEDDSIASDFKKEQEKTTTRAGKMLLSLKGKGMSEAGEAQKQYRQAINEVKQGVSEAISQEQVPPGYHQGIRGYFDSIDEQPDDTTTERQP